MTDYCILFNINLVRWKIFLHISQELRKNKGPGVWQNIIAKGDNGRRTCEVQSTCAH